MRCYGMHAVSMPLSLSCNLHTQSCLRKHTVFIACFKTSNNMGLVECRYVQLYTDYIDRSSRHNLSVVRATATACRHGYSLPPSLQPAVTATACRHGYSLPSRLQPAQLPASCHPAGSSHTVGSTPRLLGAAPPG